MMNLYMITSEAHQEENIGCGGGGSPFVRSMLMSLPMSRVLEICVNLFLAVDSDVDALRGGTAGGILDAGVVDDDAVSG